MKAMLRKESSSRIVGAQRAAVASAKIDVGWIVLNYASAVNVEQEAAPGVLIEDLINVTGNAIMIFIVKLLRIGIGESAFCPSVGIYKPPVKSGDDNVRR